MPYINTADLNQRFGRDDEQTNQIYCGLDCCLTLEIWKELQQQLNDRPLARNLFHFRMDLLAPLLEMSLRGIKINREGRDAAINHLTWATTQMQDVLNALAEAVWDKGLNPRSPAQLQSFFFGALAIKPIYKNFKGVKKVSTDRESLEKLKDHYYAAPFIKFILAIRDTTKLLGVLKSGIDKDGRMRTSYNAGGTETGRLSSNKNVFGGGTNLQNITPKIRTIFEADPGYKLAVPDLEQAESRAVGGIMIRDFKDRRYYEACLSGDLHTTVSRMVWPTLSWTGDINKDRKIAEQPFYRQFSYRDMSKRGGHGTNYYGKPYTIAKNLKVTKQMIETFQENYLSAFGLSKWHALVATKLQTEMFMVTALGMERHFFDRPEDEATLRKAIAFEPQSIVGHITNQALLTLWREYRKVMVLLQIHDALGFQYKNDPVLEKEIHTAANELMQVPIQFGTETIRIPWEPNVGFNWGKYNYDNPDGLIKFRGYDDRVRSATRLDQLLSSLNKSFTKS